MGLRRLLGLTGLVMLGVILATALAANEGWLSEIAAPYAAPGEAM